MAALHPLDLGPGPGRVVGLAGPPRCTSESAAACGCHARVQRGGPQGHGGRFGGRRGTG